MKQAILAGIVIGTSFASSCSQPAENLILGEPQHFETLTLYPVHANDAFPDNRIKLGNYLSMSEAVGAGKVKVTEVDGGDVNNLLIENLSGDTVMILNGETVVGGKQNRMIARDVLLEPHSGKLDLNVFCVEHGRWTGGLDFAVTEQSLPPAQVRNKLKQAVLEEPDQQEIWEDIKVNLDMMVVESPTDALHDMKDNMKYRENEAKYTSQFAKVFEYTNDVVGVVVVAADGSITCDIFASPTLFKKYYPNLLQSYAATALIAHEVKEKSNLNDFWTQALGKMREEGFLGERSRKNPHFTISL